MYSVATYRLSTGNKAEELSSEAFFTANNEEVLFKFRHAIQRNEKQFYCGFCGKGLTIRGGEGRNKQRLHFRHKYKKLRDYCKYTDEDTETRRQIERKKFANEEEGELHRTLKFTIANSLETHYRADIRIEQYIKDQQNPRDHRVPDIRAIFSDKDVVVEVQITSTFLDVILGRQDFYAEHNMYLLWVVNEFKPELFHQKDILYSNKENNVFVFDGEAREKTEDEGILYLKCYHKSYYCNINGDIVLRPGFTCKLITFDDLIFNPTDYSVYYFDIDENKKQCEAEQKIIKNRIRKEAEQRRKQLEAIRIEQEKEEKERQRLWQIEKEKLCEEEEKRQREEEEQRQKEEAERKERERLDNIKRQQQTKIEDCVYRESISLNDFWQYYQQLNDEELRFADEEIHNIILKSVYHHYTYYEKQYSYKYDKNIKDFYYFLLTNKYPYDWEQFKNVPEEYFKRSDYELKMNLPLYEYITLNLYVNHDYHLPDKDKERYLSKITRRFENIIEESQSREKYHDYAVTFEDIEMIIWCYERVYESPFRPNKNVYKLIYEKREIFRHLFSIYLGELVGNDFDEKRWYSSFYNTRLVSPYYHLYKTLIQSRNKIFHNFGLVPNLVISLKEIERNISIQGINPNYDLDALMPIIFPDIQWALQQTLF